MARNWLMEVYGNGVEGFFFRSLRFPARPVEIAVAAEDWKNAKADLAAAQTRHQEAGARLSRQRLGEAPDVSRAEVDELGAKIAPAAAAEQSAKVEYQRLVAEYTTNAVSGLEEPLQRYTEEIGRKIDELESLLSLGSLLHSESTAAKITLPSKITALCPHMMIHIGAMRGVLQVAKK